MTASEPPWEDRVVLLDVAVELDHAITTHRAALEEAAAAELTEAARGALLDSALAIATVLRSSQRRSAPLADHIPELDVSAAVTVLWTLQNSMLVMYDAEIGDELALSREEFDLLVDQSQLNRWIIAVGELAATTGPIAADDLVGTDGGPDERRQSAGGRD